MTAESFFLKTVAAVSVLAEKAGVYALLRATNARKVTILMYHGITAIQDPVANFDGKHIEVAKFERQLEYLLKHYSIISMDDFLAVRKGEKKIPRNSVLLTFDDGYANCYMHLFPLLKKYKVPAAIFLPTAYTARKDPAWYDAVAYCISQTKEIEIKLSE